MNLVDIILVVLMIAIGLCVVGALFVWIERVFFRRYLRKRDLHIDSSSSERWAQDDLKGGKDEEAQHGPEHGPFEEE